MNELRTILITCGSFALTAMVIGNAYYQKKQFYPSVVFITKSNPSMAVLYVQAFVLVVLMGKLFRKIFFGQLRAAEMEHLIERSWYAVTETCLAFTVFRDDFSPKFVASFTFLLFLKCFHWLADDRVDYMERSPVISFLFHIRVLSLLSVLSILDVYFVNHAYYSTLTKGASVQLVFGFEYAILMTIIMMALMKYILHSIDLQSENPWENKAVYLLYSELILGFIKMILYIVFMVIMIKIHTFPLFAIRPMYLSIRAFKKSLHDVIMSRRAIRQMNTLYPDVSIEELQSGDNVCIICREEMTIGCKKLPCGHIFHTNCLRSWFQRQQTCPTCRMEVLQMPQPRPTPPPPQQIHPQPQQQQQQPMMPNMFGAGFPPMWPPQVPPFPQQQAPASSAMSQSTTSSTTTTTSTAGLSTGSIPSPPAAATGTPPMMQPPFMPMFMQSSFPRPPINLTNLSEEELRAMEGTQRENIEARIQWLIDIQTLLDGAVFLMNQYNQVAASTNVPIIRTSQSSDILQQNRSSNQSNQSTSQTRSDPSSTTENFQEGHPDITQTDIEGLEEATGYTPPTVETIPAWENPRLEEHSDEMDEVRRRRLERFQSDSSDKQTSSEETKHNAHID